MLMRFSLPVWLCLGPYEHICYYALFNRTFFRIVSVSRTGGFQVLGRVDPQIVRFWEVVQRECTEEERALLLHFVTACPRPPSLGFQVSCDNICLHLFLLSFFRDDSMDIDRFFFFWLVWIGTASSFRDSAGRMQ